MSETLVFVYNADSGKLNTALDIAHKLLSPSTYNCQLCQITHDVFKEKAAWADFRESANENLIFLHRDEFERQYHRQDKYPVVMRLTNDGLQTLLSHKDISEIDDTDGLIAGLQEKLGQPD